MVQTGPEKHWPKNSQITEHILLTADGQSRASADRIFSQILTLGAIFFALALDSRAIYPHLSPVWIWQSRRESASILEK
jgi:hypothetical protein